MAVHANFNSSGKILGYIPGRKGWWKRAISKARRRGWKNIVVLK